MYHKLRLASTLLLIGLLFPLAVPQRAVCADDAVPSRWTPELMLHVRRVASVRPSPDGKRVAYTVAQAVMTEDRSEFVSQIWIANADGSDPLQMTFGTKSAANPVWSPDGRFLAFVSDRSGKGNLYRLCVAGGEAEQLTDLKSAVGAFAWSPDGKQIAFVMTDAPTDEDNQKSKAREDARWVDRDPKRDRLYVLSVPTPGESGNAESEKAEPRLLTPGDITISSAARPGGVSFDWSPDGKTIVFSHRKNPSANDWPAADVSVVDVATGNLRPLATTGGSESSPMFSPDGRSVALLVSEDPPRWAGSYALQVVPAEGGQPKALPASYDQQPSLIGWSADGARLYFSETRGTLNRLHAIGIESGKLEELYAGDELVRSFELNSRRTMFGFLLESPRRAPEAYVSSGERFSPVQVSRVNTRADRPPLGKVEVVRWSSPDGREIEGLLTYPSDYQAGTRVPLLLQIHGGPTGVFLQTYPGSAATYPNAAFASNGFAILQPNPRGSSGYGREFRYANYQDWGGGDFRDLMSGVDHLIERGVADQERLGVMGWSYGGYMTSWTITQTRRFKAAAVGAAVTNLVSFTGTADIPGFLADYLGAQPWDDVTLYRGRSAVFNAKGVTTPTLVQHGDADVRVPVSQGYEFYNALKQQGAPVEMLVLPRQPHGPTEPRMILKLMQTNLDWFSKHLGKEEVAVDFGELERCVQQELAQTRTPGAAIAVVKGDRVLFSKGFGLANVETAQPVTPDMLFRLGSTTKMFTAAALVSLAEEGQLQLDGPVGSCIPGLHASIAALTPHQLLTHTAGLTDESIMSGLHDESALAAGVRTMNASWLFTQPGRLHSYANPGYWIAGLACAEVAGKPYADVLEQRLFRPLAMTRTTLKPTLAMTWPLALGHEVRSGSPAVIRPQADNAATWPAGQMYSSVEELARFAIAMLNQGKLDGRQVLSTALISKLSEPYVARPGSDDHYGYGLVVGDYRGVRLLSHGGSRAGYGSTIRLAPEHKVGVIILANRSTSSLPKSAAKALDLMLPVGPETPAVPNTPQSFTESELARLAGVYSNHRQTLELFARDGKLLLRRGSTDAVPVIKLGENRLAAGSSDADAENASTTLFVVRSAEGAPEFLCSRSRALKRQPPVAEVGKPD